MNVITQRGCALRIISLKALCFVVVLLSLCCGCVAVGGFCFCAEICFVEIQWLFLRLQLVLLVLLVVVLVVVYWISSMVRCCVFT